MEDRNIYIEKTADNITFIFKMYDSILRKFSWRFSKFDNDLYSEQKLALLKCIHNFQFDEKTFKKIYKSSADDLLP